MTTESGMTIVTALIRPRIFTAEADSFVHIREIEGPRHEAPP